MVLDYRHTQWPSWAWGWVEGGKWLCLQRGHHSARACSLQVKESTVNIDENGVRLELTLVDTPGFGDLVDNSQWCANTVDGVCRVNAWL